MSEEQQPQQPQQSEEELKVFVEYLKRGTLLLDLKEMDALHFAIDQNDAAAKELADLVHTQGVNPENYESVIRPKAIVIMEKAFDEAKRKEFHGVLAAIEGAYQDNEEICKISLASKLFLEDENARHSYLPIAVARLLEDIYATFYINQQPGQA